MSFKKILPFIITFFVIWFILTQGEWKGPRKPIKENIYSEEDAFAASYGDRVLIDKCLYKKIRTNTSGYGNNYQLIHQHSCSHNFKTP